MKKVLKIPELLVPVGGSEQLQAAISSGTDAIYMGSTAFNARMNAENFHIDELYESIRKAHEYGVKVHITQNILLHDRELNSAIKQVKLLYEMGVDAVILQDRGFAYRIHKMFPDLPLHLSTQGTVTDVGGVIDAYKAGFSRVILARELSLNEIKYIKANSPIEIEVFVHGAICVCYSGQCHMSNFIGGRSGNRGECAQPCRLTYQLLRNKEKIKNENGSYLISTADMYLLEHLKELTLAGVDSLKVEGRMRSPEYVAAVTGAYRRALDSLRDGRERSIKEIEEDREIIGAIYNRGNFTDSYLKGERGASLMSKELPRHKGVEVGELLSINPRKGHLEVRLLRDLNIGDGVELRGEKCDTGNIVTYIRPIGKNLKSSNINTGEKGMKVILGDFELKNKFFKPGDKLYRTKDSKLVKKISSSYLKILPKVALSMEFYGITGVPASLIVSGIGKSEKVIVTVNSKDVIEKAIHKATDEETVRKQLGKTGGTPYFLKDCQIILSKDAIIPASVLNSLRRDALKKLTEERMKTWEYDGKINIKAGDAFYKNNSIFDSRVKKSKGNINYLSDQLFKKPMLNIYFYPIKNLGSKVDSLVNKLNNYSNVEISIPYQELDKINNFDNINIIAYLPPILTKDITEDEIEKLVWFCKIGKLKGISLGHPSQCNLFKKYPNISIRLEESANTYNMETVNYWKNEENVSKVLLSYELSVDDILEMNKNIENPDNKSTDIREVAVYGRIPLMITAHCPVECNKTGVCQKNQYYLMDRKGMNMPLILNKTNCSCTILSYKPIDLINEIPKLIEGKLSNFRILIYDENLYDIYEKIMKIIDIFR